MSTITPHNPDPNTARLVLLVPKPHVKHVKSALEKHAHFDRHNGISPDPETQQMRIPTTLPAHASESTTTNILTTLDLTHLAPTITLTSWTPPPPPSPLNPLRRALAAALALLPPSTLETLSHPPSTLLSTFPETYSIYPPLLLLPPLPQPWPTLLALPPPTLTPLWSHIATALNCTHIALNAPIPPANTSPSHAHDAQNHLRSPVNLVPLYGDFGPAPTPRSLAAPTAHDFASALWVRALQNGIAQTWAPRFTMFSRGNVKEKARVLNMSSVTSLVNSHGPHEGTQSAPADAAAAALDLYAGIGYFAFSYRRAGLKPVVAWELNPWSVEGMRRGCVMNGWTSRVVSGGEEATHSVVSRIRANPMVTEDFLIFSLSNTSSAALLPRLAPALPRIRHVNLGLLPVSRPSWHLAVGALLHERGGWIHAHENVGVGELDARRREVEGEFARLWRLAGGQSGEKGRVEVVHVERVKMYAPGVVHAVFDVWIPGTCTHERRP